MILTNKIKLLLVLFMISTLACEKKKKEEEASTTPINLTAPTIASHAADGTMKSTVEVSFAATDANHSSFECSYDGAEYSTCTSPHTVTDIGFGTHNLNVRSVDVAGNKGEAVNSSWLTSNKFKAILPNGTSSEQLVIGGVAVDANGIIYIGTWAGPRVSNDGGQTFTSVNNGLVSNYRTYKIRVGPSNEVYAVLQTGIGYTSDQGANWTKYTTTEGLGSNTASELYIDTTGKVFVATGAGLSIKASGATTFTNHTTGLPSTDCRSVTKDDTGRVLVGTASGLARSTVASETDFSSLLTGSITDVSAWGSNIIVAINSGIKISLDDGVTWTAKTTTHGLPSNSTYNVHVDDRGYFYVTTSSGFAYSTDEGQTWITYGESDGIANLNTYDINTDSSGRMFLGTVEGFSMTYFSGTSATLPTSSDVTAPSVSDLALTSSQVKSYKFTLSWNKATDTETAQTDLDYALFTSSSDNISTVSTAYLNGSLYQGHYFKDLNSLSVKTTPGDNKYFTLVVINPSGAKSIYTSTLVASPKITWTEVADLSSVTGAQNIWYGRAVSFLNKMWMLAGLDGPNVLISNKIWSSSDGATWTEETPAGDFNFRYGHAAIAFNNKLWMTDGIGGASNLGNTAQNSLLSSTDGINWTTELATASWVSSGVGRMYAEMLVHDGKLYHIGGQANDGTTTKYADVWSSSDGSNWSFESASLTSGSGLSEFSAVSFGGKIYVISDTNVYSSPTGSTWTNLGAHSIPGGAHQVQVIADHMMCLFAGSGSSTYLDYTYCSTDGVTWTPSSDTIPFETKIGEYGMSTVFNDDIYFMMGAKQSYPKKVYRMD